MELGGLKTRGYPPIVRYGSLIIGLILWYSFILVPINQRIETRTIALESQQLKLSRLRKRLRKLSGIDKQYAQEKRRFEQMKSGLVPGSTIQMVSTNLQNSFLKLASKAQVEVLVYRSGRPRKWRDYELAVSIFNIKSDIVKFLTLLEEIEIQKKYQRLNNINLSTRRSGGLRVNMEIEALFLGEKALP